MMYHLDGRWRRQSLVYFGQAVRLIRANVAGGAFREARGVCSRAATVKSLVAAND